MADLSTSSFGSTLRDVLRLAAPAFWAWYPDHVDDVVLNRRVWFVTVDITVGELRPLFVLLFGEPADAPFTPAA